MRRLLGGLALAVTVAASGCGSEQATAPTTITLQAQLANAASGDRALLVDIAGTDTAARIDTVTAPVGSSYTVFAQRLTKIGWRAIVTGTLANGAVLRLQVPGKNKATAYRATILDVADGSFAELAAGSRALTITP